MTWLTPRTAPVPPHSMHATWNEIAQAVNAGADGVVAALGVPFTTTGTAENTNIVKFTLPPGFLAKSGDGVEFEIFGVNAADVNVKTVTLLFGALSTGYTVTGSAAQWRITGKWLRMGTDAQRLSSMLLVTATPSILVGSGTVDDGAEIVVELRATAATSGTITINGAVFKQLRGRY